MSFPDDDIEACLASGWQWHEFTDTEQVLLPPKGDIRHTWCAEFRLWKPGYRYPHWLDHRKDGGY